jgi:hypothetical protein
VKESERVMAMMQERRERAAAKEVKQQYIAASDLIPFAWFGLVCQGCETEERWRLGDGRTKADMVISARRLGWVRLEVNGGMRTFCAECAELAKQGDALAEADAAFWQEDGGTH